MTPADTETLIRQVIGGDPAATTRLADRARSSDEPTTRDRQLIAIAAAHLAGDADRVDALARDHLVDYPDSILVAWIAAACPPGERENVMNRRLTAALLVAAAVLTTVAFTALGSVFNYPDVLKEPAADVLAAFRESQGAVTGWFTLMAVSAALFAPIAIGVGRLSNHTAMRLAVPVGIAAGAVQMIGLARWPLLVPGYAADAASTDPAVAAAALDSFETAHRILGTLVGKPSAICSPRPGRCWSWPQSAATSPAAGSAS